jgi:hypothetical protein
MWGNLNKHWDGNLTRDTCPGQDDAIKAGAKLPLTHKQIKAHQTLKQATMIDRFVENAKFCNRTLNQVLFIWLIKSSLPWAWLEDFILGAAFSYVWRGFNLYSCTWAATEAHQLYLNLQQKVMSQIQVSGIVWSSSILLFFSLPMFAHISLSNQRSPSFTTSGQQRATNMPLWAYHLAIYLMIGVIELSTLDLSLYCGHTKESILQSHLQMSSWRQTFKKR